MAATLSVVVANGCEMCDVAREIAEQVRGAAPTVQVEIIELDGEYPVPEEVVATPTYLLDGRVIFLGNPGLDQLLERIMDCLNTPRGQASGAESDYALGPGRE